MKIRLILSMLCIFTGFMEDSGIVEAENVRKSIVRISVSTQSPNYREPWKRSGMGGGIGTGFIIDKKRVMTNAHVVSNARFIQLQREGSSRRFVAKVKFIAHDCDLAILELEDNEFFKGSKTLDFGDIPKLNSSVAAYGYPIGGSRMSITRGIVSRIEFRQYSHSSMDSHLTIQVDAAINPGNSGGPIIQNQKVIGVAFQGYRGSVAQNTGYMIPTPVIKRMLQDIKDSKYDGYVELAVDHDNLENPVMREYLGLKDDNIGVYVNRVVEAGSAFGKIKEGDVLLKIDGKTISSDGKIKIDGELIQLEEIVERKFHGDKVKFELFREKKTQTVEITLKGCAPYRIFANQYEEDPPYLVFAGMVFQVANRNMIGAHGIKNEQVMHVYNFYLKDKYYIKHPEIVVLSSILPDPVNTEFAKYVHSLISEINGVKIKYLKDVETAFAKKTDFHSIMLEGNLRPLIIKSADIDVVNKRILTRYGITKDRLIK
ncbi:MAG: trypsin-like peptidase domain-containing protein [Lentisphaeria bacterium]|nr:serine protease [Lentisphaeria bacterium]NQZ69408.1 trypsin-like peptidase domain-containing protein [Lentisphaeria bacterium]